MTMTDHTRAPAPVTSPHLHQPLRVALLVSSVRRERLGRVLADWVASRVAAAGMEVDMIDLAEHPLPDDALLQPGGGGPRSSLADRIQAADAFVVLTPEYNHSYPASLKRLIDWHYDEWMFKAAMIVPYGLQGGLLAAEHLRGVFAELHVVTTRRCVGLRAPWEHLDEQGFGAPAGVVSALDAAVGELAWWGDLLRSARRHHPFAP